MKGYMDVHEAATRLGLSEETIRRYLRGKHPFMRGARLGVEWRIPVEEVERILREGVRGPGRPTGPNYERDEQE